MQITGIGNWANNLFQTQQRPGGTGTGKSTAESPASIVENASASNSLPTAAPGPHSMTGDQVRDLLNSHGIMSLHAFSITEEFRPDGGGYEAVSNVPEDWIQKMGGMIGFDQEHGLSNFVQQDTAILHVLENA